MTGHTGQQKNMNTLAQDDAIARMELARTELHDAMELSREVDQARPICDRIGAWRMQIIGPEGVEILLASFLAEHIVELEGWLKTREIDPTDFRGHFHWIEERAKRLERLITLQSLINPAEAVKSLYEGLLTSVVLQVPSPSSSPVHPQDGGDQ